MFANAVPVGGRSLGSLASARKIAKATPGGTSERSRVGSSAERLRCAEASSNIETSPKGGRPATASYATPPSA
jgi:hypothetical protein